MRVIVAPIVLAFPVQIPRGFVPLDLDADGTDLNHAGRPCPGYEPPYQPRWGGGFLAPRGPRKLAHRALDIMAAEGALVVAPTACSVREVALTPKGGHCLYLVDAAGWTWYMAHLASAPLVAEGAELEAGALVGYVGRTGNASYHVRRGRRGCPHLHVSLTRPAGSTLPVRVKRLLRLLASDEETGEKLRVSGEKVDLQPLLAGLYHAGGWRR